MSNVAEYRDCVVYGVEVSNLKGDRISIVIWMTYESMLSVWQVPGSEGRAGMAAILDKEDSLDLAQIADGLRKNLPSYARPLFIRILNHVEMTGKLGITTVLISIDLAFVTRHLFCRLVGTYKMKKVELQSEGIDPNKINDRLYYLSSKGQYERLTPDVYRDILAEKLRL